MTVINLMKEHRKDMLAQQKQQFAQLMEVLTMVRGGAQGPSAEPVAGTAAVSNGALHAESVPPADPSSRTLSTPRLPENESQECPVKWLATQIPEFGGTEKESVTVWVNRIDKVALIHGSVVRRAGFFRACAAMLTVRLVVTGTYLVSAEG